VLIENILSPAFVKNRAEEISEAQIRKEMPKTEGIINFLSVGRFSYPKNYDNVPDICKRINSQFSILNSQVRLRWYIIGFGADEARIRQKIVESGMQDSVILLGKKTNPYPYIKACDVYVQPSRYEGKSVTVREAQMLCKPIIVTDYPTAKSQVQNSIDGIIVPLDNEQCAKSIVQAISSPSRLGCLANYLQLHDYGNMEEIQKLDQLLV
jgi:glycosyltransferase involved in cell wall biosynthesis